MRKLIITTIVLLLNSCANIGSLGGGKVDDQAPKLMKSNLSKTNFTGKKIYFDFDEYITLNNPEKNIILQPSHTTMKFSISGKMLIISFDSSLKKNTTYNLIIDKGIADNNANNPFQYAVTFSTGNSIDTGQITVKINDYKDKKTLKIALSTNDGSDSFKNFKSDYILDANKDLIQFNGLNSTNYNIWLFTDDDNDLKPDIYKPINFIKTPKKDSTYQIRAINWPEPFRIKKAYTDNYYLKIKYTSTINYPKNIKEIFSKHPEIQFIYYNTDSALVLLKTTLPELAIKIDTVPTIDFKKEARNIVFSSMQVIKQKADFKVKFTQPQYYTDNSEIKSMSEITVNNKKQDSFLMFPWNNKTEIPDTFYIKNFQLTDYKSLSYINIDIKNKMGKNYDLVILKDDKEFIKVYNIHSYEKYIPPGVYKIQVFENSLHKIFDPYSLSPAPTQFYEKQIMLKANWEELLSIDLP